MRKVESAQPMDVPIPIVPRRDIENIEELAAPRDRSREEIIGEMPRITRKNADQRASVSIQNRCAKRDDRKRNSLFPHALLKGGAYLLDVGSQRITEDDLHVKVTCIVRVPVVAKQPR